MESKTENTNTQLSPNQSASTSSSLRVPKRIIIFILFLILLFIIVIGVIYYVGGRNFPFLPRISVQNSDNPILATVGDQPISLVDVKNEASEQFAGEVTDKTILQTFLNRLIEQNLLNREAREQGIVITQEQILEELGTADPNSVSTVQLENARYDLIREKIVEGFVTSRDAYTIGFWIRPDAYGGPPLTEERQALILQQRIDGRSALDEAEQRLISGEEPYEIAQSLYEDYPSLQSILAVNGGFLSDAESTNTFTTPQVYTYNQENKGNPIFETVFSLPVNGIAQVVDTEKGTYAVVQVVAVSGGEYVTYEDWLSAHTEELVTIQNSL